jgi:hypothetical protein
MAGNVMVRLGDKPSNADAASSLSSEEPRGQQCSSPQENFRTMQPGELRAGAISEASDLGLPQLP